MDSEASPSMQQYIYLYVMLMVLQMLKLIGQIHISEKGSIDW
jgi:hypothetical protein